MWLFNSEYIRCSVAENCSSHMQHILVAFAEEMKRKKKIWNKNSNDATNVNICFNEMNFQVFSDFV